MNGLTRTATQTRSPAAMTEELIEMILSMNAAVIL